jgi:hypothetical protein
MTFDAKGHLAADDPAVFIIQAGGNGPGNSLNLIYRYCLSWKITVSRIGFEEGSR